MHVFLVGVWGPWLLKVVLGGTGEGRLLQLGFCTGSSSPLPSQLAMVPVLHRRSSTTRPVPTSMNKSYESRQSLSNLACASHRVCTETAAFSSALRPVKVQIIFPTCEEERVAASSDWSAVEAAIAYAGLQFPYLKNTIWSAK